MKGDTRFIRTLQLRNLLSFGPDSEPIEFGPLNVLIGPNGSGKSNIIEAIDLLRASASSFGVPIREGGGATEWLWKGPTKKDSQGRPLRVSSFSLSSTETFPTAEINATVNYPDNEVPLRHRLSFTAADQRFSLSGEAIENERDESSDGMLVRFFSRFQGGDDPVLTLKLLRKTMVPRRAITERFGNCGPQNFPRIDLSFLNIEILPISLK